MNRHFYESPANYNMIYTHDGNHDPLPSDAERGDLKFDFAEGNIKTFNGLNWVPVHINVPMPAPSFDLFLDDLYEKLQSLQIDMENLKSSSEEFDQVRSQFDMVQDAYQNLMLAIKLSKDVK